LTNDPLGFAAGDVNFYRYVGNGPENRVDPTGEAWWWPPDWFRAKPIPETNGGKGEAFENVKLPFLDQAVMYLSDTSKYNRLKDAITDGKVIVPLIGNVKKGAGIGKGTHAFFNGYPEMGSHFGTGGADPCVGVIIICNDNGKLYGGIFHFDPEDNGVSTISQYKWKGIIAAYVFGGNNNDNLSYYQYRNLYSFLKKETNGKTWAFEGSNGYVNSIGMVEVYEYKRYMNRNE